MLSILLQAATNLYGETNDYSSDNGRSSGSNSGGSSFGRSGYTRKYTPRPQPNSQPVNLNNNNHLNRAQDAVSNLFSPTATSTHPPDSNNCSQYSLFNPKFYFCEVVRDWNASMAFLHKHTGVGVFDRMYYRSGEGDPWHWSHLVALLLALLFLFALYNMLIHGMGVGTAIDPFASARERDRIRAERNGLNEPPKYRSVSEAPNLSAANRYRKGQNQNDNGYQLNNNDDQNGRNFGEGRYQNGKSY